MSDVWIGMLHDGRLVLDTEPKPADAPIVDGKSIWKRAWKCELKNRWYKCGAPEGVTCRCREVLL